MTARALLFQLVIQNHNVRKFDLPIISPALLPVLSENRISYHQYTKVNAFQPYGTKNGLHPAGAGLSRA